MRFNQSKKKNKIILTGFPPGPRLPTAPFSPRSPFTPLSPLTVFMTAASANLMKYQPL